MSQIHWASQINADFGVKADWTGGAVPGATDDATFDASGSTFYTVTASTSETVAGIELASTAELSITAGTFTATTGTAAGANAGVMAVGDGTTLALGGAVDNTGAITLGGAKAATNLDLLGNTTLSGGGSIILSSSAENAIFGASSAVTLTNANNTITGGGQIGKGQLTLVNEAKGVIDATTSNALVIDTTGENLTNSGLLEGAGTGGLTVQNTVVHNAGGVIQ